MTHLTHLVALVEPPVSNLEVALRVLAALALGGLIGFERELSHQPAGLRTHIAVALGAALFGVLSVHGFDAYVQDRESNNYQIDVTRVASQVVVGIGFLGGGTILKHGAGIRGLTTAASLWVTAAVGLATGVGSFVAAAITTVALVLSLVGLRAPRERLRRRLGRSRGNVALKVRAGGDASAVVSAILALDATVRDLSIQRDGEGSTVEAEIVGPIGVDLWTLLRPVTDREDVIDVDIP